MPEIYPVGMAELRIAQPPDKLAVYGVGSCVIVAMYDPKTRIGGLVHVMLPDSTVISQDRINPRKFADTAVPLLFQTLSHAGIFKSNVWVKMVGGAEMFPPTEDYSDSIGQKNATAVEAAVKKLGIPILAQEVGGSTGRSLELNLETGKIAVTVLGDSLKEI
jgi:chemotaxis protein CheD